MFPQLRSTPPPLWPHAASLRAKPRPAKTISSVLLYEAYPYLSGVPDILGGLGDTERALIEDAGRAINFVAGEHLFRQGERHDGIFILNEGIVRSYYVAPNGREITLAAWQTGNFVGGPEIFGGGVHVWSGVALTNGRALHLPGATIPKLMHDVPGFALGLVKGLAFKGKCYSALLQMLGTRSVVERLALVLLNLAERDALPRPVSHEDLAALVGATRQWVSITMARFRKNGFISSNKKKLEILSPDALRAIAAGNNR